MPIISNRLARLLNVFLMITLLGGMLPPAQLVSAAPESASTAWPSTGRPLITPAVVLNRDNALSSTRGEVNEDTSVPDVELKGIHESITSPQTFALPFNFVQKADPASGLRLAGPAAEYPDSRSDTLVPGQENGGELSGDNAIAAARPYALTIEPTILFEDNFDAENGGSGTALYSNFTQWDGSAELFGPGGYDPYPGHGLYIFGVNVDLTSKATFQLVPGLYRIQADAAGFYQGYNGEINFGLMDLGGDWLNAAYFDFEAEGSFATYYKDFLVLEPVNVKLGFGENDTDPSYVDNLKLIKLVSLPFDQTLSPHECPFCYNGGPYYGGPIEPRSGNYNYEVTDLSIPTLGQMLQFERSYNSIPVAGAAVYSNPLGYGWTHNYDINLTLPDDPGGEAGTVILKAPHGSRLRFADNGDSTYSAYPGVWAELTRQGSAAPYTYVITTANQTVYTFGLLTDAVAIEPIATTPPLSLTLTPDYTVGAAPGTVLTLTHTLTNTDAATDTYDLSATSAGNWLSIEPVTATLASSQSLTVTALITAPSTIGRDTVVTASLTAASQTTPTLSSTVVITLALRGYRLLSTVDPQGNETDFDYDSSGYLGQVSDPTGQRYFNFDYDPQAQGRLTAVTDHTGRTVGYGYDADNNLAVITDTRDLTWTYTYTTPQDSSETPHYLHQITDPDGRVVERTFFDTAGRAVRQEDGLDQPLVEMTYINGDTDYTRVVVDNGKVVTDTYDFSGMWISHEDVSGVQTFGYDNAFNRTSATDANGNPPTIYNRDAFGLTHAITDALGFTTTFTYDDRNNLESSTDARGNTTTYTYDAQNNLKSVTNPLSGTTVYTYNFYGQAMATRDENGNLTQYAYDGFGNRTVITDALNNVTRYDYDSLGRVITSTDALGKVTVNEYDAADNLVQVTENYLAGQPQNYQNEYNLITTYTYDGANRQETTTDTLGRANRNVYDAAGRLAQTITNEHPTVSTQNYQNEYNLMTTYGYDEFGRQVSVTDTLGRETRTVYDTVGRVERTIVNYEDGAYTSEQPDQDLITSYVYDNNGNVVSTVDGLGRQTRTEYDELNRVERTIENYMDSEGEGGGGPDTNLITSYSYDETGNQATVTDPLDRVTRYSYDALNRVETMTNPLNGTTNYEYDPAGNRIAMTDAENHTTTYDYDALNRVITTTDALGGINRVTYDEVGNRLSATDANNHTTTFEYDSLYRLIATTNAENETSLTTYDALGNRLTSTDAANNTTTFVYDSLNRLIETTNPLNGTNSVTYDALGNRLTSTDANNHTTSYAYDDLNRLVSTTDPNSLVTTITYDGLGNRRRITNGAGEITEFEYDGVNRLVFVADPLANSTEYGYDKAGNRTARIDAAGIATRYEYDDLNRLTAVTENYNDGSFNPDFTDEDVRVEYAYDAVGNRTEVTDARNNTTAYTYDALNRRITLSDPLNQVTYYGYDAIGNRTVITDANRVVTHFSYDEVNRLTDIDYDDSTPDVSFTYDNAGNRQTMTDGTGTTRYEYDDLYRLTEITDGANQTVAYGYDAVGNRTQLIYPNNQVVTYTYDAANRLYVVTDWHNGQFGYDYDDANRLSGLSLPNGVESDYSYDDAGRLTLLAHNNLTETLASYEYQLDNVGNRTRLDEELVTVRDLPAGAYLESGGLVVMEAEHFGQRINGPTHQWNLKTGQSGYTGTSYLQPLPDIDTLYQTSEITASPQAAYPIDFTTPGAYTVWLRGYPTNAAGDSVYLGLGQQVISLTGFTPFSWTWASEATPLVVTSTGVSTVSLWMREDGLRIDRLLITTDTSYIPTDYGPVETERQIGGDGLIIPLTRTIVYTYDNLYRLTGAGYTTGENYQYSYDPVGNRLEQIINGNTTEYQYDAANRLAQVDGQSFTFDDNGNLLSTGALTNTFDAANRLVETERDGTTLEPIYNGVGDRVGQTEGVTTTYFVLDVQGLPEVIYTSEGNSYLHLPGVIMTENVTGEVRYLLSDGLGSVRQAIDQTGNVVAYNEFDPYGNPVQNGNSPYGFTGEWWQGEVGLLHLRARWLLPETGTFLSKDAWEGDHLQPSTFNGWNYAVGNPIRYTDPAGYCVLVPPVDTVGCFAILAFATVGGAVAIGGTYYLYRHREETRQALETTAAQVVMSVEELRELYNRPSAPEPDDQPKPLPIPWSGPTPQTPEETCTPTPDPDQDKLVFYHGTSTAHVANFGAGQYIKTTGEEGIQDFGAAFYTTKQLNEAIEWAGDRRSTKVSADKYVVGIEVERSKFYSLQGHYTTPWEYRLGVTYDDYHKGIRKTREEIDAFNLSFDYIYGPVSTDPTWEQYAFKSQTALAVLNSSSRSIYKVVPPRQLILIERVIP